jgi:Na+/H+ antiporter NhaA
MNHVNVNTVPVLKCDHRLERLFQLSFVPLLAFDNAGIAITRSGLMHSLLDKGVRQIAS